MLTENINEVDLRQKISQDSARITAEIKAEIGDLETEYLTARKEQKLGILLIVVAFLMPHVFSIFFMEVFAFLFMFIMLPCIFYGFKLSIGKLAIIKNYHTSVNQVIFRKVFSVLGLNANLVKTDIPIEYDISRQPIMLMLKKRSLGNNLYSQLYRFITDTAHAINRKSSTKEITVLQDLDQSELITQNHNSNQVDDVLQIIHNDSIIKIAELDIKNVTGSGKHRHTEHIFYGYFISFDLKRELAGKTFVSAEDDKRGFGNLSAFGNDKPGQVRETILEWNEFENLLHVATTDESEARYVLTPNFMHGLYDWWQGRKANIRLSFIKNRLYILYPDSKIRLNQSVEKITEEEVAEYMYTIAWPLQNVLKLIDDVKL